MPKKYRGTFLALVVMLIAAVAPNASANLAPVHTPPTDVQVWTVNIEHFAKPAWDGFVNRMQANQFAPDIILVQELTSTEAVAFINRVRELLGSHYSAPETSAGDNVIIWNTDRFSKLGVIRWAQTGTCGNGKEAVAVNLRDNAASSAFLETRNIAAASIHFRTDGSNACLNDAWDRANNALDSLTSIRRMTIMGGDVNRRPDTRAETIAEGLETDPFCWYRRVSAAHGNNLVTGENCLAEGNFTKDRYYDTVWTHTGSGGGTNPTATSFCQQFTRVNVFDLPQTDTNGVANSCTDLNLNNELDKSRIDYIWVSYEKANGVPWTPPTPAVAAHIPFASADLGISLEPTDDVAKRYADHRAVQSLLTWPATMAP